MQNTYYYPPAPPERTVKLEYRSDVGKAGSTLLLSELMMTVITIFAMMVPIMIMFFSEITAIAQGTSTMTGAEFTEKVQYMLEGNSSLIITLLASAAGSIIGLNIPILVYAHKRNIDVFDLFRGGKFTAGFMLGASCLALTLNYAWGFLYAYLCELMPVLEYDLGDSVLEFPTDSVWGILAYIFTVCIVAPIFEEIAFRGVLLKALCKYGTVFGIITTSLFFGLFHGNISQTPATFLIALVLGYAAVKTGSIWCGILIHAVNNSIATLMSALYAFFPEAEWLTYFDYALLALLVIGAIAFLISRPGFIPKEGRKPATPTVKHRYLHFFTSIWNVVFIVLFLFVIVMGLNFQF